MYCYMISTPLRFISGGGNRPGDAAWGDGEAGAAGEGAESHAEDAIQQQGGAGSTQSSPGTEGQEERRPTTRG